MIVLPSYSTNCLPFESIRSTLMDSSVINNLVNATLYFLTSFSTDLLDKRKNVG
jgi:hypothetical protein